jgi:hypothetical protein
MDPWRLGGLEQALRQDDHGEVPRRIDESGCAEATVPAECAAGWIDGDNGLTEPHCGRRGSIWRLAPSFQTCRTRGDQRLQLLVMLGTVGLVDVRRLAAVDMYGSAGSRLRRRLILAEFVVGAAGGIALGLLVAFRGTSVGRRLIGAWIVGIGINYVALAVRAASLSRRGVLDAELAGVDVWRELRRYSYLQFWIVVPLLMAVLSVRHVRRR